MDEATLRRLHVFDGLSRKQRRLLASRADELEVPPGKTLCSKGETAHEFFVIEDGAASVRQDGEEIAMLGPGDFFGEIALLESPRRTATVVALTPMQLLVMHARDFKAMEHELPLVADRLRAAIYARLN